MSVVVSIHSSASAERDLTAAQTSAWYGNQFAILSALTLANVAALTVGPPTNAPGYMPHFFEESATLDNFSPLSANVSDVGLWTSLALPPLTLSGSNSYAWTNAMLIYAEALEASMLATSVVKRAVRRARPYTQGSHRPTFESDPRGYADANHSFYSGHTSLSFTAAVAGSLLFDSLHQNEAVSMIHFGGTLALSAFTGHLRIRAGRHYPSDVLVGAVLGTFFGAALPLLHEVRITVTPLDLLSAASGVTLGYLCGYALPNSVATKVANLHPNFAPRPGGGLVTFIWATD